MSNDASTAVPSRILDRAGLTTRDIERTLGTIMRRSIDEADLYFQVSEQESWTLEDGIVREGHYDRQQGVGVRAIGGDKTGFAYSDEMVAPALSQAASAARAIVRQGADGVVAPWRRSAPTPLYGGESPLASLPDEKKTAVLRELDAQVRAMDPRIE